MARIKRKTPTAYHHEDLRRALIDAAAASMAKDGVDALKVSVLAQRLGVTDAAPFRHSPLLQEMTAASETTLDAVLGRRSRGSSSPELVFRSAAMLAAQALSFGLARMITDGLLGDINAKQAEPLAYEVTGVLGAGLGAVR